MRQGRPYPPDKERRIRIKIELAQRDMTVSDLARALHIHQGNLSAIINGTRLSKKTEERIAAYFGMPRQELFPPRTKGELEAMRRAAAADKGRAA
ncbi:MAG: helix-turn-helix transcriptional regulator [Treponema sp.]|jgi:plasmid maintenance system antidote protein VapI|nr:helix-turn-helix transcriptional regulator [Treponema sp.]